MDVYTIFFDSVIFRKSGEQDNILYYIVSIKNQYK